jgi:hypothetical protein
VSPWAQSACPTPHAGASWATSRWDSQPIALQPTSNRRAGGVLLIRLPEEGAVPVVSEYSAAPEAGGRARRILLLTLAGWVPSPEPQPAHRLLISQLKSGDNLSMISTLLQPFRLFPIFCGGHCQLALENLALRQQLAVYKRTAPRPTLRTMDRLFWVGLARVWTGWRQALLVVSPDTILRWQRRRCRDYWSQFSGRATGGRPSVDPQSPPSSGKWPRRIPCGVLPASTGAAEARHRHR